MNPDVHSYVREIYELWTIAASSSDKGFHNCQFNILCSPCISFILKMVQAYRNVESCLLYSNIYCIHHTLKRKFDTREIYYTQNFIYFKYFYVLSSMGSFRKLRLIFFYYMYMWNFNDLHIYILKSCCNINIRLRIFFTHFHLGRKFVWKGCQVHTGHLVVSNGWNYTQIVHHAWKNL